MNKIISQKLLMTVFAALAATGIATADDWLHYAADVHRSGSSQGAPDALSAVLWTASQYPTGTTIAFEGPSSPVVFNGSVFANARHLVSNVHVNNKLVAINAATGQVEWQTLVAKSVLDSWSSPAVDDANSLVLLATGAKLHAIDAVTGELKWAAQLNRNVVNASPLMLSDSVTGRAFITDFDGFGESASLYCINTSPHDIENNPYAPGDIVWIEPIGGASGATAAAQGRRVFVASITASEFGCNGVGAITAFDVDAPAETRRAWTSCVGTGFFGGVTVAGDFIYAASYRLTGSGDNSMLVKINATDGQLAWTIPCERTSSIPIVSVGRIYLSAGINGFGSAPKVQCYRDDGGSAVKLWDTFVDTGGSLILGGWTHQPMLADGVLYVGKIPLSGGFFGAYTDLYMLDVAKTPNDPAFVMDHRAGVGSSPALVNGRLYSIGPGGLVALAALGDCNGDGSLNGLDIACFLNRLTNGATPAEAALLDFTTDGQLTMDDVPSFVEALLGIP